MSFEEDFPSLKEKEWWFGVNNEDFTVLQKDIVECCVDKQRLRKAIEKMEDWGYDNISLHDAATVGIGDMINILKKELGL